MVVELSRHPYFRPWRDPQSGALSYILHERVAPFQKGLYYATPSVSADNRWLWFSAVFPPSRAEHLAVVSLDADRPLIRWFPQRLSGGPMVLPSGDAVYVPIADGIYRLALDGTTEEVVRLPAELIANRHLFRVATNLTVSADGRHMVLDAQIGNRTVLCLVDLAAGRVTALRSLAAMHHHVYMSPTDPDLFLVSQAPYYDAFTGEKAEMNIRIWVMDIGQTRFEPILPDLWFGRNCMSCHEWWEPDGMVAWCDYREGVYETDVRVRNRQKVLVWPRPMCHAQCDREKRLYVGDQNPYERTRERPCRVFVFDRGTGRDAAIVSRMAVPEMARKDWRGYHFDPHPHFSPDGGMVVYTTTVRGVPDVAVAPVAALRDILRTRRPRRSRASEPPPTPIPTLASKGTAQNGIPDRGRTARLRDRKTRGTGEGGGAAVCTSAPGRR